MCYCYLWCNSEEAYKTMKLIIFPFNGNGPVRVRIPETGRREVKASVTFLENCSVADEFEASLLGMECLYHIVGDSVDPSLSLLLVVCFAFKMLGDNLVAGLIQLFFDRTKLDFRHCNTI